MKAAIYARVSTSNGSQTCENQLLELRRYCDARGWIVHAEYTDEMSGAKDRRPGLDRLLLDARRAKINVVVCWALDRIGRDLKHLLAVLEDLQSLNIPFVSLKEGLDLGSASGRLQLAILAALSQFERERLRERTIAGLERARAQGKRLGRPSEPVPLRKARIGEGHLGARGRQTVWASPDQRFSAGDHWPDKTPPSRADLSPQNPQRIRATSNAGGGRNIRSFSRAVDLFERLPNRMQALRRALAADESCGQADYFSAGAGAKSHRDVVRGHRVSASV